MTKVIDYMIVEVRMTQATETSRTKAAVALALKVRDSLINGWRPEGGIVVAVCGIDTFLYQPMVKFSD